MNSVLAMSVKEPVINKGKMIAYNFSLFMKFSVNLSGWFLYKIKFLPHNNSACLSAIKPFNMFEFTDLISWMPCQGPAFLWMWINIIKIPGTGGQHIIFLLITVSLLHWENDADFNPSPKRPRSLSALCSPWWFVPYFIASNNSSDVIPHPLSHIATLQSDGSTGKKNLDIWSTCTYAVIHYIGDSGFKRVSHGTHWIHQDIGIRTILTVVWHFITPL